MMSHPRYLALSATHKNEQSQVTTSLIPSLNSILHSNLQFHPSLHPSIPSFTQSLTPIFKPHPSNSSLIPPPKNVPPHNLILLLHLIRIFAIILLCLAFKCVVSFFKRSVKFQKKKHYASKCEISKGRHLYQKVILQARCHYE